MKKLYQILFFILIGMNISQAQVAINEDASDPDRSALLDIKSTSMGLLIPRMNFSQMYQVQEPATGLLVFNTSVNQFFFFNGKKWISILNTSENTLQIASIQKLIHLTPNKTPKNPHEGDIYMDESLHILRCWNGEEWKNFW
jgi:hypothetical protein